MRRGPLDEPVSHRVKADAVAMRMDAVGCLKERGAVMLVRRLRLAAVGFALLTPPWAWLDAAEVRFLDLAGQTSRQVIVDREPGQYLGHPTTVVLEDGETVLCVYPRGHGAGAICLKRSVDGGRTWSGRLPVPDNWSRSKETPTIHRVVDAEGRRRLILFSGLHPVRMSVSEDDGATWSALEPVGDWGGIVAMASVVPLRTGPAGQPRGELRQPYYWFRQRGSP